MKKIFLIPVFLMLVFSTEAFAFDLNSAVFSINSEKKGIDNIAQIQEIEKLLVDFEGAWNAHEVDKIGIFYSDTFINGDGLDFDAVKELTAELWKAYPDVKTSTKERTIRIYGDYATVESTDIYQGTSLGIRDDVGTKGTLKAVSIGEIYLKKFGPKWKITSDKTSFERVGIGYGVGNELIDSDQVQLSAPEQVFSGKNYTASLKFNMPKDYKAVASIGKELLVYPQFSSQDRFRLVDTTLLERFFSANKTSKNELISATVGITGGVLQPRLLGLIFLTRRVNVVPVANTIRELQIVTDSASNSLSNRADDYFYPDSNQVDVLIQPLNTNDIEFNFKK